MEDSRRVAVVTGAARGIGRAIAAALAAEGWMVAAVDLRDVEGVENEPAIRAWRADVADLACHEKLLAEISDALGTPSCLVNNAGVTSLKRGDLLEVTPESFDRVMSVNVRGSFFLSQHFARRLIADRSMPPDRFKSIVWIGSANAEIVGDQRADYCISKAATAMMNKLFASRLAESGICTFEIRPGIISTDMTAPARERYDRFIAEGGVPIARWGQPADIARTVATLARGDVPYCTGTHLDVGGGLQLHRV